MKRDYLYLVILILGFLSLYLGGYINFNKTDNIQETQYQIDSLKMVIELNNETLIKINNNIGTFQDSLYKLSSKLDQNNKQIVKIKDDLEEKIFDVNEFTSDDSYNYFSNYYNLQK